MSKNQPQKQPNSGFIDPMQMQNYYQCAYCRTHFLPKKRFVQKYCSESCRVMACRARKNGQQEDYAPQLRGNHTPQPHATPAAQHPHPPKSQTPPGMDDLMKLLEKREKDLQKKLDKIQSQQNYHMVISALAPLLAEPVRKRLGRWFQGNKTPQDVNQFLQQVAPKIKELPEELQVMVLNASKEYWSASMGGNDAGQKKGVVGLPDLKDAL